MAAEKLTKQRLAQILIMMALLIIAFVWRTLEHYDSPVECPPSGECSVNKNEKTSENVQTDKLASDTED